MWFIFAVLCVSPIEVSDNYPEYTADLVEWAAQEQVELVVRTNVMDLCKLKTNKMKVLGKFDGELFPKSGKMWMKQPGVVQEPYKIKFSQSLDCPTCRRVR